MTFPGTPIEPSLSNFCTKAMILLSMSGQDWQPDFMMDPRKAPFGKLPALRTPHGVLADSNLMIPYLERRGADLFPALDAKARAQAHAVMRMAEENLRYGMMYDRWVEPDGWAAFAPVAFKHMPKAVRLILPGKLRKSVVQGLKWQGLGRYGRDERLTCFKADLTALTDLLDEQAWLMGDQPSAADASVVPILSGIETLPVDTGLRGALRGNTRLMDYVARGRDQLYAPITALPAFAA